MLIFRRRSINDDGVIMIPVHLGPPTLFRGGLECCCLLEVWLGSTKWICAHAMTIIKKPCWSGDVVDDIQRERHRIFLSEQLCHLLSISSTTPTEFWVSFHT